MKKFIVVLAVLFSAQAVSGQDKIITKLHDTVSCKIVSISSTHIRYEQTNDGRTVGQFIPLEDVLEYSRLNSNYSRPKHPKQPLSSRWRVGLQFGGSYLLASTSDGENQMMSVGIPRKKAEDYYNQYRYGFHAGGDVHYLYNEYIGFGVKYLFFGSSANLDFAYNVGDGINYLDVSERDRIYVNFVGPSIISGQWLGRARRFKLTEEFSIGYSNLREEMRFSRYSYLLTSNGLITGHAVGINLEASIEYYLSEWASVCANIGIFGSSFQTVTFTDKTSSQKIELSEENYENVSRFDYSLGIRFHFNK
jgi:hypothetical protein